MNEFSIEEAVAGHNACIRNGERLLEDSRELLEMGRYASALHLAILALEEFGKTRAIRALLDAASEGELRQARHQFNDHARKNTVFLFWELIELRDPFSEQPRIRLDVEDDFGRWVEVLKQQATYVDWDPGEGWHEPRDAAFARRARLFVTLGALLAGCVRAFATPLEADRFSALWDVEPTFLLDEREMESLAAFRAGAWRYGDTETAI